MPSTPNLALPYPANTDPTTGPAQIQALAQGVEAKLPWGVQYPTTAVTSTATFASAATAYAIHSGYTLTVPTGGRKYFVLCRAVFVLASGSSGRYLIQPQYNTGSTVDRDANLVAGGTTTGFGDTNSVVNTVTGTPGSQSQQAWGVISLTAGTYTFSVRVVRQNNGSTSDTAISPSLTVLDAGPA